MPKLAYKDIGPAQADNVHGRHKKIGWVIHETVSPNYSGWGDVVQVSEYLDNKDYGIHSVTDGEGHVAWALGYGNAVFYHTDSDNHDANSNMIGIEQVSRVMLDYKSRADRIKAWLHMQPELHATAKIIAASARAQDMDLSYIVNNTGNTQAKGVTTHWEVTNNYHIYGGHVDAWPTKRGGYYPKGMVITLARRYYVAGYHL